MKLRTLIPITLLAMSLLVGCSGGDAATTTEPTATTTSGATAAAEMAKCDSCGKEVAKATLVSHDAKMMCQECMASHNH